MSLLHPALLFGLLLAAVPVVLHLLMRARPKKLIFPALRLLQQRRVHNQRRMRLRHLWLLLLRIGMIVALVLAVARPSLPPANYSLTIWETGLLAAILSMSLAAYFAVMIHWQRRRIPQHTLLNQRTYLRAGLGLGAVLMSLLLVAWPYQRRVAAEITSPAPTVSDNLPVAALFVCDTSLSTTYLYEGATRLEAARQIATSHLERLPSGSVAAVLDGAGEIPAVMSPDLAAVQNRLSALVPQPVVRSLNDQILTAVRFQEDERRRTLGEQATIAEERRQDKYVREIYVLTDLAKSAWRADESQSLKARLDELKWLGIYLIDVGVERPTNTGIVDLRLTRQTVGVGGHANVEATVRTIGTSTAEAVVELWQATDDGVLSKRDQQTVPLSTEQAAKVQFTLDTINGRLLQGSLRLVSSDPLPMDDQAHFTVKVLRPLRVLVSAPNPSTARYWLVALNALGSIGSAYDVKYVDAGQLPQTDLSEFDIACLINLPRPADEDWQRMLAFAEQGGGILICLGAPSSLAAGTVNGIDPVAYLSQTAQQLLPVKPKASLRFSAPQHLNFREGAHPMSQRLETLGALAELGDVDFRRYWSVEPAPGSAVLARWTDDAASPALLMQAVGRGRCAVFTSSVDSISWSGWPVNWTIVAVADQWLQLLSRQAASTHTLLVGDPVVVPIDVEAPPNELLLRQPNLTQRRVSVAAATKDVTLMDALAAGHYQVFTTGTAPELLTGFSLNVPAPESDLTRFSSGELDELLGKGRYGVARDPEQLTRSVLAGRLGQEISGLLLTLLMLVFVVEQSTATWFYRQDEAPPQ